MSNPTTLGAARTQYLENADYADGGGDVTKARAYRTACRALLVLLPTSASAGPHSTTMDPKLIAAELADVRTWLAANDTGQTASSRGAVVISRRASR